MTFGSPMRATTYRPCDSMGDLERLAVPVHRDRDVVGCPQRAGCARVGRSKNRKMPCLPTPGKSTVSVSVTARSPFAATWKSASYRVIVVSSAPLAVELSDWMPVAGRTISTARATAAMTVTTTRFMAVRLGARRVCPP